jgi:3-oxoacyl-[acyl-carrier-protein] synthase III
MATVIERIELTRGGWRDRHSALRLAVRAARDCLHETGRTPHDIDLLVNAGIYRDRNLGEPALAAMIQQDIGANPEAPHAGSHGTFSFDIMNGSCGVLTALQIVDGFLRSHSIDCALIVASDADPGHGMSERFPFSPAGAALLCTWTDDDRGFGRSYWASALDERESFSATVGLVDNRNILRFDVAATADIHLANVAAHAVERCLSESRRTIDDIDAIAAAPAQPRFRTALAGQLGVSQNLITIANDEHMHTASLASSLNDAATKVGAGGQLLLVAAGAGVTAGAALYRV